MNTNPQPSYQHQTSLKICLLCNQPIGDTDIVITKKILGEVHYGCANLFESSLDDSEG